jgi:hypothetical protein
MYGVGTNGMSSKFGLCNSRIKRRFVTKRVHLKLSTDENSFDLERGEAGSQNFEIFTSNKQRISVTHTRHWHAFVFGRAN